MKFIPSRNAVRVLIKAQNPLKARTRCVIAIAREQKERQRSSKPSRLLERSLPTNHGHCSSDYGAADFPWCTASTYGSISSRLEFDEQTTCVVLASGESSITVVLIPFGVTDL